MKRELRRILVVEDRKDVADSLAALLRLEGYDVHVCYDGPSAIEHASQRLPTDAIIDIGLPGLSGYAVGQHIRELPFGSDVLLIALTAYADPAEIEKARYAGFNWHLTKPLPVSVLMDVLKSPRQAAMHKDAVLLNSPG